MTVMASISCRWKTDFKTKTTNSIVVKSSLWSRTLKSRGFFKRVRLSATVSSSES
jgi:hypothetical protein